jgi:hypothetical protein
MLANFVAKRVRGAVWIVAGKVKLHCQEELLEETAVNTGSGANHLFSAL